MHIKKCIYNEAFKQLTYEQSQHSKIRHIQYDNLVQQQYLTSAHLDNEEASLLFSLRSKTVRGIKRNFSILYKDNNMMCELCKTNEDSQEHCLQCPELLRNITNVKKHIKYEQLFGSLIDQIEVTQYFKQLLDIRTKLMEQYPALNSVGPQHS